MTQIAQSVLTLLFFGDDIDPDDITKKMGYPPTTAFRTGEIKHGSEGRRYAQKTGSWRLQAEKAEPGDLDRQVREVFGKLTHDLTIWRDLTSRHGAELFIGLFMGKGNEMVGISAGALKMISDRGLQLEFDIYDGGENQA